MITTILIMTIINSLILVAFLVLFFSIKDAHEETMLYLSKNNEFAEKENVTDFKKLEEGLGAVNKRIDNIEVKPIHNTTLIEQLKSEIVQLKNELLLQDMDEIVPPPHTSIKSVTPKDSIKEIKDIEDKAFANLQKIWDKFKKEKKPKKKKKFVWTDKKVKDFANNYNTKAIDGCKDVKDKLEYYKQKNK